MTGQMAGHCKACSSSCRSPTTSHSHGAVHAPQSWGALRTGDGDAVGLPPHAGSHELHDLCKPGRAQVTSTLMNMRFMRSACQLSEKEARDCPLAVRQSCCHCR